MNPLLGRLAALRRRVLLLEGWRGVCAFFAALVGVIVLAIGLVAGHFLYRYPEFASIALWRLGDPFGAHTWTTVQVADPPPVVAEGAPLAIKATFSGIMPRNARVEVLASGQDPQR